jgi:hypothetical protein
VLIAAAPSNTGRLTGLVQNEIHNEGTLTEEPVVSKTQNDCVAPSSIHVFLWKMAKSSGAVAAEASEKKKKGTSPSRDKSSIAELSLNG